MESTSIELKDSKGENMIGSVGNFDESEVKKRKIIRIIIIVSFILLAAIVTFILYFLLRPNYNKCSKGGNDKCHTCQKNSKKCATCNPHFTLDDGKCLFIYSFEALYKKSQLNDINTNTKLFNVEYLTEYKINKIQVDGEYAETTTNYYNFTSDGEHQVRVNIDLKDSSSLKKFFSGINELISINFTNHFNTTNVENIDEMFSSAKNLISLNLSNLNTEKVKSMKNMFSSCINLPKIDLSSLNTSKVESTEGLFSSCESLTDIDVSFLNLEKNKDMSSMFNQCISLKNINFRGINIKNVLNTSNMFNGCTSLESIDFIYLSSENVKDMSNMFKNTGNLNGTDFTKLKTDNVENMFGLFENSKMTSLNLSGFETKKVTNMGNMFKDCIKLIEINFPNFKTDNVENMFGMFENSSVTSLDLSSFETKKAINMGKMFKDCKFLSSLKLNFNTENVENMSYMFSFCNNLISLNISMFNTKNCKDFSDIFENVTNMDIYIDSINCKNLFDEIPETFIIHNIPSMPVIGEIKIEK